MNARALRIACLGECMIELSGLDASDGRARLGVAGDTLNTAIYLARLLGDRGTVSYLTALGDDGLSDRMVASIAAEGIETEHIVRLPGKLPGLYAIELDAAGERRFHYWRQSAAARSMFRLGGLTPQVLDRFDVIYLTGISLAILPAEDRAALIRQLTARQAAGALIAFDSNHRPRLWESAAAARACLAEVWPATSLALPSLDDIRTLWGEVDPMQVLDELRSVGVAEIVLKRGAEGPLVFAEGKVIEVACPAAETVIDTTAAGDSFNAGYLAARLTGDAPDVAARRAHDLALKVIAHPGAILPADAMP